MFAGLCQLWGLVFVLDPSFNASFPSWNKCELKKGVCRSEDSVLAGMLTRRQMWMGRGGTIGLSRPLAIWIRVEMVCARYLRLMSYWRKPAHWVVRKRAFLTEFCWPFAGGSKSFNQGRNSLLSASCKKGPAQVGWENLKSKLWSLKAASASQASVGGILAGAAAAVFLAHRLY